VKPHGSSGLTGHPADFSLNWVRHVTTIAKWLAGLSGAGVVLAFAFYMQAYLWILSIKNDCASQRFVADAFSAGDYRLLVSTNSVPNGSANRK
jgi:hypothetical protein